MQAETKKINSVIVASQHCIESLFCASILATMLRKDQLKNSSSQTATGEENTVDKPDYQVELVDRIASDSYSGLTALCSNAEHVYFVGNPPTTYTGLLLDSGVKKFIIPYGGYPVVPADDEIYDETVHGRVTLIASLIQTFERWFEVLLKNPDCGLPNLKGFELVSYLTGIPAYVLEYYAASINMLVHDVDNPILHNPNNIKPEERAALAIRHLRTHSVIGTFDRIWNNTPVESPCHMEIYSQIQNGINTTTVMSSPIIGEPSSLIINVYIMPLKDLEYVRWYARRNYGKNFTIAWTKNDQTVYSFSFEKERKDFFQEVFKNSKNWYEGDILYVKKNGFFTTSYK